MNDDNNQLLATLRSYAGKRRNQVRNPRFTAHECIAIADHVAMLESDRLAMLRLIQNDRTELERIRAIINSAPLMAIVSVCEIAAEGNSGTAVRETLEWLATLTGQMTNG